MYGFFREQSKCTKISGDSCTTLWMYWSHCIVNFSYFYLSKAIFFKLLEIWTNEGKKNSSSGIWLSINSIALPPAPHLQPRHTCIVPFLFLWWVICCVSHSFPLKSIQNFLNNLCISFMKEDNNVCLLICNFLNT